MWLRVLKGLMSSDSACSIGTSPGWVWKVWHWRGWNLWSMVCPALASRGPSWKPWRSGQLMVSLLMKCKNVHNDTLLNDHTAVAGIYTPIHWFRYSDMLMRVYSSSKELYYTLESKLYHSWSTKCCVWCTRGAQSCRFSLSLSLSLSLWVTWTFQKST